MTLLIDGCVREHSRTRELAVLAAEKAGGTVEVVSVRGDWPAPLDAAALAQRDAAIQQGAYGAPILRFARQFAAADTIVLAAPYWDLLFPAAVRAYLEAVTVSGVTFAYDEHGVPHGLCRAGQLIYVTTAGGPITGNYGFDYVAALCRSFYGIDRVRCFSAEGLDIFGADTAGIMEAAKITIAQAEF